ncbi:unnamed protein product [Rhizoctonia solani]|uniref:F-box domain-containing protein n=1 Tax=Rhizoctonia solani TaxID=456999 RepID=A0A8H2X0X0_9AGAM|nr:unnamed protein product [Rhizoctonia solani]
MKSTAKKTKPVQSGTTRKSAPKSTSKAPPKKKARNDQPSPEKEVERRLALHFANLPLDLFIEIAKHLYPLDLIHLSRANKLLRSMFMRRSAAEVWRAALSNVGLPPCPDDSMPEPRYAALMFLEQCTECYKSATRHMDPIFLVRLCYACRKRMVLGAEAVRELGAVLTHSQYLIPPRGKARPDWYLLREFEEIQAITSEVEGDQDVWKDWIKGRVKLVRARHERAEPLVKWLENRGEEQKQAINDLKNARAAQVEARLLKLGWELADIREGENYSDEWTSLVYKTKPLGNKDWKDMLPFLLDGLEKARESRLDKERYERAQTRKSIAENWLRLLSDQLCPTDLTLRWRKPGTCLTHGSTEASCGPLYPEGISKQDITIRIPSIPPISDLIQCCPHLHELLDRDMPTEEFQVEFQKKQSYLKEQYSSWRANLETALVKQLPKGLKPVETESSDFDLLPMARPSDGDSRELGDLLSLDLRVLLRADVQFGLQYGTFYYPKCFDSLTADKLGSAHHVASCNTAKAILHALQRPDASYLEMRALGKSFLCLRCIDDPKYYTWDNIVSHYIHEDNWGEVNRLKECPAQEGKGITFLPTHSIDGDDKPLVRLIAMQDQVPRSNAPQMECKVCLEISRSCRTGDAHIVRHVREVHLIENPVLGEHYAEVRQSRHY